MKWILTVLVSLLVPTVLADDGAYKAFLNETLQELADSQEEDGRWKAPEKTPDGLTDDGVTALGLLVYAAAGDTHRHGAHKQKVEQALQYLAGRLDKHGRVTGGFANQAFVTLAITELYAVTRDFRYKRPALLANQALQRQQNADGSFGDPKSGGIYETALAVLSLRSAVVAELKVKPAPYQELALGYLDAQLDPETLRPKEKTGPLQATGAAAAVYVGRRCSLPRESRGKDDLQKALREHLLKAALPVGDPRDAYLLAFALLFTKDEAAWKAFAETQDKWAARGKRSETLPGRLFETMAMQARERHERTAK